MTGIATCLWFAREAEEAARFYVGLFPRSALDHVTRSPGDGLGGRAGDVLAVEFTLDGRPFVALNGGPGDFTQAMSLVATAADQAEVDRLWDALTQRGSPSRCGWLTDRYGFAWQVVPERLAELIRHPDPARAARVFGAMMAMGKIDVAALEAAASG